MPTAAARSNSTAVPAPAFGCFTLLRLLGKSDASMLWLALDTRSGAEVMLAMPRIAPADAAGLEGWLFAAGRAARLDHPNLAPVVECAAHEGWPYVCVDRRAGVTLDEWRLLHPRPNVEEATVWIAGALRGLAFAHDAGVAHLDPQLHTLLIDDRGHVSAMALAVAGASAGGEAGASRVAASPGIAFDVSSLQAQRLAAERDVLACGLLLHRLLAGDDALANADPARLIERMARGRELIRLPWTTPQPVDEGLRAIVNRSTSDQSRLRYRSARTFLGALVGWREALAGEAGGPVGLLLDRLRSVGHLPALPGLARRVQRLTLTEGERTDQIARHLLPDLALSFELLRTLNSARVQGTQITGNGPVLTLRRVVALIGVDGVRESANNLRNWPGPLDDHAARALRATIDRVRLAGHVAQALRPAGYDSEVVYLVTALQNLGRLLLRYHFADEAVQVDQLMQPAAPSASRFAELGPVAAEQPGLGEDAAAYAVLGVEIEALGHAAAKSWGFADDVLHMIRRLPNVPVRRPDGDADLLRIVASAANEAVDALGLRPAEMAPALARVGTRYSRTLGLDIRALRSALKDGKEAMRSGLSRERGPGADEEAMPADAASPS